MAKRNPANKGKGKVITAAFGAVKVGKHTLSAVLMATAKKGTAKGGPAAFYTQLWAIVPGQPNAPQGMPFVLTIAIAPLGIVQAHPCTLAQGQACYNAHPRRVASGQGSPAAQFGLAPKPMASVAAPSPASPAS